MRSIDSPRRRHRRIAAMLSVFLVIFAACGGGEPDPAATQESPGTSATSTTLPSTVTSTTTSAGEDDSEPAPDDETPAETTTSTSAAPSGPSERLKAITERGSLRVGLTSDVAPFGSIAGDGFETQLALAVAALVAPGATVEFVLVAPSDRFISLAVGDIDILVGSTHTLSREQEAAFSQPYLVSGIVALVASGSDILSTLDLGGTTIALRDGHITGRDMADTLASAGVSFTAEAVSNSAQGVAGVVSGAYDAYAATWAEAVATIEREAPGLEIAPVDVLANPLGLATPPADSAFAQEVDAALQQVIDDGTWLSLFEEWIGGSPPWSVEEMASVPASS